jgi:hypothetical protein
MASHIYSAVQDVTENKLAEQALKAREAELRRARVAVRESFSTSLDD